MSAARAKAETDAIDRIAEFLKRDCGLVFADNKRYLFEQRLIQLFDRYGLDSLDQLAQALSHNALLRRDVIHQMTTHETLFFRDNPQFQALEKELLPEVANRLAARKRQRLPARPAFWSAACSTGQEPYSLAMLLRELRAERLNLGLGVEDLRILASDISEEVIAKAKMGRFSSMEMGRGMDATRTAKYFRADGQGYQICPELRESIDFRCLNITRPFGAIGRFDLILCRNVLIYFSQETARRVIDRFATTQESGAFLMLGASESIYPRHEAYDEVKVGGFPVYRRK